MRNYLNFTDGEIARQEADETIEEQLFRLAATWRNDQIPLKEWDHYFLENATIPYPNMNPVAAYQKSLILAKTWQKTQVLGCQLEELRKISPVVLAPTYIEVTATKERKAIIMGDVAETLTPFHKMAREVANILTICSTGKEELPTHPGETRKFFVTSFNKKQMSEALMYNIDVGLVRKTFQYPGGQNLTTRDGMYTAMVKDLNAQGKDADIRRKQARAYIMMLMDDLASQALPHVVEMPEQSVEFFNKYKPERIHARKKMYMFHFSKTKVFGDCKNHTKAWQTYITSFQYTGSSKVNLMAGYNIMDFSPGFADKIEEAFDIINCMHSYGFEAVGLYVPNQVLANLIISSGFSVYCGAIGVGNQGPKDPVGLYNTGNRKCMRWIPNKQLRPQALKTGALDFPRPNGFNGSSCFMYEFIPSTEEFGLYYLPSMKAASGLCIKTNHNLEKGNSCRVTDLLTRFNMAVYCRSQFIFNRVTFSAIDPMWRFFGHGVILTRTTIEENAETFSQLAERAQAVRFGDEKTRERWEQDGVNIEFSPVIDERNTSVEPGQVPDTFSKMSRADIEAQFKILLKAFESDPALLKRWFYDIVSRVTISEKTVASYVAVLSQSVVLGEIAEIGQFRITVDISPTGDVVFKDKEFWKDFILPNNLPPEPPKDPSPLPPAGDPDDDDVDDLFKGGTSLNFTQKT